MEKDEQKFATPAVFISYSHDSPEHKQWVAELASRLRREAGIKASIDQWEVGPGDDLGLFMERSVATSDRVLMICSEAYTQKVNEGKGGAGYEGGIVRGEIIDKFGTNKFIPIIPPGNHDKKIPSCVKTRMYLDMSSTEIFDERFLELVKTIREYNASQKPELGISPKILMLEQSEINVLKKAAEISVETATAIDSYNHARAIIRANDCSEWQKFIRKAKQNSIERISSYRQACEHNTIHTISEAGEMAALAAETYAPLFAAAIAGVESNVEYFRHQAALVADILAPANWNRSGITVFAELPSTIAYVYHSLIGAAAVKTRQFDLVFELANFMIVNSNYAEKLLQNHSINGYEPSLGSNFIDGVKFLQSLFPKWKWLAEIFESNDEYQATLSVYNILLVFCDLINSPKIPEKDEDCSPWSVPPAFLFTGYTAIVLTKQMLMNDAQQIQNFLKQNNMSPERFEAAWNCYYKRCLNSHFGFNYNLRDAEENFSDLARLIVQR